MADIKEQFELYRKRVCKINNKKLEIENLMINGSNADNQLVKKLEIEISKMENENKKIDNILSLLDEKEYKVISLIYLQGKDKKKVARELDRTKRQINYSISKGLKQIEKDLVV